MNLLELVTYLRTNILEDNGGQGVDWTGWDENTYDTIQLRWSNETLVAYINEAITQVYRRTNPVKDIWFLPLTALINDYTIPPYVQTIELVRRLSDGRSLNKKELEEIWEYRDLETRVAEPVYYIVDTQTNNLRVYPIPVVDDTLELIIYRLAKIKLTWADNQETVPELREDYHIPLLNYAASLAYKKDEANTLDPNRSAMFAAEFDREFPFVSAYSNIRKSRTSNRPVRYGGL
jgi:hypothetical protein